MELLQLKYFIELAEIQHLRKTAEKLYISAPSLSLTISKLEQGLGVSLFDRNGRSIALNEKGLIFYRYAKRALSTIDAGIEAINKAEEELQDTLSVALSSPPTWDTCMYNFQTSYPQIKLHTELVSYEALKASREWKFDFLIGITREIDKERFHYKVLRSAEMPLIVLSVNHPLASRKHLSLKDLQDETFICPNVPTVNQYLLDMCEIAEFKPKRIHISDYFFRTKLAEDNKGIILTTDFGLKNNIKLTNKIKIIPVSFPILTRTQAIAWEKGTSISKVGTIFMNFLLDYLKEH